MVNRFSRHKANGLRTSSSFELGPVGARLFAPSRFSALLLRRVHVVDEIRVTPARTLRRRLSFRFALRAECGVTASFRRRPVPWCSVSLFHALLSNAANNVYTGAKGKRLDGGEPSGRNEKPFESAGVLKLSFDSTALTGNYPRSF